MRHRDGRVVIFAIARGGTLLDRNDATWVVRAGLADASSLSLESRNFVGSFLRHENGAAFLHPNDGTEQFAMDATFHAAAGKGGLGISFFSHNYPTRYLRHYAGEVFIAAKGGPEPWASATSWEDDVTWLARPSWLV